LNKHILTDVLEEQGEKFAIAFIYLPSEVMDYTNIEKGMIKSLHKMVTKITLPKDNQHE